jgi:hypothetical protein
VNQIVLAAGIPFTVAVLAYALRKGRTSLRFLIVTPLVMSACALWAVVPDIPRVLGCQSLYRRLSRDPRCDIFFWHYTIDLREKDSGWFFVAFVIMLLLLTAAGCRELRRREERPS